METNMEITTLKDLKEHFKTIVGDWDGEETRFTSGGDMYTEEQAHQANEIVEKINELEELIKSFHG
mgnify:CR=1 FL=1